MKMFLLGMLVMYLITSIIIYLAYGLDIEEFYMFWGILINPIVITLKKFFKKY